MKIRLAKLVDISNISTLYRTLFQTMAELQIEYYRKADQDVDFLKSVINSDTKDILVAEEDEQIIGFVLVQQLDTPPYACIVPHRYRTQVWQRALSFRISRREKSHFPK